MGFFIEFIVVKTNCYENIVKKSTLKRLGKYFIKEAKKLEN